MELQNTNQWDFWNKFYIPGAFSQDFCRLTDRVKAWIYRITYIIYRSCIVFVCCWYSAGQAPLAALRGSLGLDSCPAWQMCLYDVLWLGGLSWLIKWILLLLLLHIISYKMSNYATSSVISSNKLHAEFILRLRVPYKSNKSAYNISVAVIILITKFIILW